MRNLHEIFLSKVYEALDIVFVEPSANDSKIIYFYVGGWTIDDGNLLGLCCLYGSGGMTLKHL